MLIGIDMVNKVLQIIMIGISGYLIFAIGKTMIKERIEERKREIYIINQNYSSCYNLLILLSEA